MSVRRLLLLVTLFALPAQAALAASNLLVPQQFATIQAAVDAAGNGDTILIKGGTYSQTVAVFGFTGLRILGKGKVILVPPSGDEGLALTLCVDCTVEKLAVTAPASNGISLFDCVGIHVDHCRVEGASGDGIHVKNCGTVSIESCVVTDAGHDAIALGEDVNFPAASCLALHNKLSGAGHDAVSVRGNGNSVVGNVVSGAGNAGCEVPDGADSAGNVFSGNKLTACPIGFILSGDDNLVSGNTISHTSDDAVLLVTGSGHSILGNKMISPGGAGVFANHAIPGVVVSQNKVSKAGTRGLYLGCDGAVVVGNVLKGAVSDGLVLDGAAALCLGNVSSGNGGTGFVLDGDDHVLSGNVAKGNAGFDLDDSGVNNTVDATNVFGTVAP